LKENSVGMFTGLMSMTAGFVSGVDAKMHGGSYLAAYRSDSAIWEDAGNQFLGWADSYLRMGEGFGMMSQAGDWAFDKTIGKEGLGGWFSQTPAAFWVVNHLF
jgi:hypothetical protein